jgi:hypothetical protein
VDLNHRPLGYEPNELPDCSTPRFDDSNRVLHGQTRKHACTGEMPVPPFANTFAMGTLLAALVRLKCESDTLHCFSLGRSQASTILVGSMAELSTCSSKIRPSLPIRKFTRRAALYLST